MSDCPIHGCLLCDAHDFWCDAPKCLGPCNCYRPARLADHTKPMSNVLRVPRPAGSGRPNKGRKLTSLYLDEWLIEAADALAKAEEVNRSEMLRRLVAEALRARSEFNRETRP